MERDLSCEQSRAASEKDGDLVTDKENLHGRLLAATDWDQQWNVWFDRYSAGTPRFGIWIRSLGFPQSTRSLEIGAGSARDSRYLCSVFKNATAVDFSATAIDCLARCSTPSNFRAVCADAGNLPFPDREFDLSFARGFVGLFSTAEATSKIVEQARVTKSCMLVGLHNLHNLRLRDSFDEKRRNDSLYNMSFYSRSEGIGLVRSALAGGSREFRIDALKFGSPLFNRISRSTWMPDWMLRKSALADVWSPIRLAENLVIRVDFV